MKTILLWMTVAVLIINAQNKDDKIMFLEFNYADGIPTLINMKAVDGKLKTGKSFIGSENQFYFEVLTKENKLFFNGNAIDPTKNVYEAADENGRIITVEEKINRDKFYLRIPYNNNIDKVVIYKNGKQNKLYKTFADEGNKYEFIINHSAIMKD
jgi:hypothetical protein